MENFYNIIVHKIIVYGHQIDIIIMLMVGILIIEFKSEKDNYLLMW